MGWHPSEYSDSFSVGELNANCEAKIVDDSENEVPQGERGEIWLRAPNVMKGYWNRPDATRETLTPDGWLKTGDIAYIDKTGKFFIVDRKKVRTLISVVILLTLSRNSSKSKATRSPPRNSRRCSWIMIQLPILQ
jgi:acyl-CoA synthetase (AMP-forming)/AMP-acid ligase II